MLGRVNGRLLGLAMTRLSTYYKMCKIDDTPLPFFRLSSLKNFVAFACFCSLCSRYCLEKIRRANQMRDRLPLILSFMPLQYDLLEGSHSSIGPPFDPCPQKIS